VKFAGKDSHVRRLTKAEHAERGIPYSQERYVVTKDYTDPFSGERHTAGDTMTNRQGRNVQTQEKAEYKSYSQYNRVWSPNARLSDADVKTRNAWLRRGSKASGRSTNELRTDPGVRQAYIQFYNISKQDRANKSPSGPLAQLLVELGLRDEDDTHDVGDTGDAAKSA
jgi:hypothetical protein